MPDLCYIIVCNEGNPDNGRIVYQSCEPERQSDRYWLGGFSKRIADAVLYPDYESANKVCNRMAEIYSNFKVRVISKSAKELFVKRLEG